MMRRLRRDLTPAMWFLARFETLRLVRLMIDLFWESSW